MKGQWETATTKGRGTSKTAMDFYWRKIVYVLLQASIGLAYITAWFYSRLVCSRRRPLQVESIAAVWYWPPDFVSASRTRLGVWKERFDLLGIRFDSFHVGRMAEVNRYVEAGSWTERYWFYTKMVWRRWRQFFALRQYDVVWIDRWFIPHYPMRRALFERCLRRIVPYLVVDSSDGRDYAVNPSLVLDVMSLADKITVAFDSLYEFYSSLFPRVERFEYPIIEDGYRVRTDHSESSPFTLGWMGSPSTFAYLKDIEGELRRVAELRPFRLMIICRQPVHLDIPHAEISYHAFGDDYFDLVASFDIGLAPYTVDDFNATGKIGMKHQEFLLCAIPQVCSPVGISEHVVDGEHVLIAHRIEDWAPAILRLMADQELRARIARNGRALCRKYYTVESQWPSVKRALTAFP